MSSVAQGKYAYISLDNERADEQVKTTTKVPVPFVVVFVCLGR